MDRYRKMEFKVQLLEGFTNWFQDIENKETRAVILLHLSLMRSGSIERCKEIGLDIFEYGIRNEYWIYFSKENQNILIIAGCFNENRNKTVEKVLEEHNGY